MIKTLSVPSPTIRLEIKASTVVKVTVAVMATKFAVHVASDVAAPYAARLTTVMKRRLAKLEEMNEKEDAEKS